MFKTLSTGDASAQHHKVLLYGPAGFGKTTNARYYRQRYGKGLILSGEGGLLSLSDTDVEYVPFTSFDKAHNPDQGVYSFVGIAKMLRSADFLASGYKWLMIDSLTEVAELCMGELDDKHVNSKNGFEKWGEYERLMVGWLKLLRDLPVHVLVTALAATEEDDNGALAHRPMVRMRKVQQHLPGIFDHVFAGVRKTLETAEGTGTRVERFLVTDGYKGYVAKSRDPRRRMAPVERGANVVELLDRITMPDSDYERWKQAQTPAPATTASKE